MNGIIEKLLINIPAMVSAWIVFLIIMSVISDHADSNDYAFGALFFFLYFGSLAIIYALLILVALSINKMTLQDSYMKMALFNLASPLFAFIIVVAYGQASYFTINGGL